MPDGQIIARTTFPALDHQRAKVSDLPSVRCRMDVATLCICPALKLRLFTAAAGHLLGIGPQHVGLALPLCRPFGLHGTLTARIKIVLESGTCEPQVVAMTSRQRLWCRMRPVRAGQTAGFVDGVILIFGSLPVDPCEDHQRARAPHDDGSLGGDWKPVSMRRFCD